LRFKNLASDANWDPSILDHELTDDDAWFDAISDVRTDPQMTLFHEFGNYKQRLEADLHYFDAEQQPMAHQAIDACVMRHSYDVHFCPVAAATDAANLTDSCCPTVDVNAREVKTRHGDCPETFVEESIDIGHQSWPHAALLAAAQDWTCSSTRRQSQVKTSQR